jgi:drug/metabolite transporter (DMT)-like permease
MKQQAAYPWLILLVPPLMWACNAILGRIAADMIPPMLFNFMRWLFVLVFLLPLAYWIFRPGSGLLIHWRRYAGLGFLSVFGYNSLQYLALHTSTAINVTLIAASMPIWMLLVGRIFYQTRITGLHLLGAACSLFGVAIVLSQGDLSRLAGLRFLAGDLYVVLAAIGWAIYSWQLKFTVKPERLRQDWAALLMAQVVYGLIPSGLFALGEVGFSAQRIQWSLPLLGILVFVAIGPAILAYKTWGEGVQRVGPTLAGFFANLTPLITALLSSLILGEYPKLFHAASFVFIVLGIWLSSRKPPQPSKS